MDTVNPISFGAFEAKTRFSELLDRVANGEEIMITKHGTPVARLVPARAANNQQARRTAILNMRELATRNRLKGLKVKDLKNEGRR